MGKKGMVIMPSTQKILTELGEQIRLARLRRNLSVDIVIQRANISRTTLWSIERGNPSVAIGLYANVLHALNGLDKDILLVAKDDELGHTYQDLNLQVKRRISK